jgi:hypothetical protein
MHADVGPLGRPRSRAISCSFQINNGASESTETIPLNLAAVTFCWPCLNASRRDLGHWGIDSGGGYTYFDPKTGHEFSAVTGFTYNFINPSTQYQNGIDWHVDWGASQFVTKQFQIGAVGYFYDQLTGDSGTGARLGSFLSRVAGVGPQFGYLFPVGDKLQGYLNLKGYWEFDAQNRATGWNTWLTFSISPAAETPPMSPLDLRKRP